MNKYKTLAGNTLIFAVFNFTSKLLVFFMMPFYTTLLSKEQFGTADMINTAVGLLLPILTLGVSEGCMRFALDKSKDSRMVFSFGVKILVGGVFLLLLSFPVLLKIPIISNYVFFLTLLYISNVSQTFLGLFARGIEKVKLVGISGIIGSFTVVVLNVLLLYFFRLGVEGYLISLIISQLIVSGILFFGGKMYLFLTKDKSVVLSKEILSYSIPMVPNSLSWWINHSANRFILGYMLGTGSVGLYSAAAKIPTIIDTFRGIFVQAWQLSTIFEYDKKDSQSFFTNIYRLYNLFLIISCSILIIFSKLIASVLYSKSFFEAWQYTPLLLASVLFGSLVAFYSPYYLAHKKTAILFKSTFLGAIITILFNLILVPLLGITGSAVSAVVSYFAIYLYLHIDSRKYVVLSTSSIKYYISYSLVVLQALLISLWSYNPLGFLSISLFVIILLINIKDVFHFLNMGTKKVKAIFDSHIKLNRK